MFIDIFRGLGTSLVEGCAGDFRQNAAECDRVQCNDVHQVHVRVPQAEPWRTDRPMPVTDRPMRALRI